MIAELRVRNLATIEDVTLPLGPGLNVLTGETGAGKSLLVDSLALLLGGRADTGAIRPGGGRAVIEGGFEEVVGSGRSAIEAAGLDLDEDRVVVRRELAPEGRSRAWINGSPTTAAVLAEVGSHLVELHGQHDLQSLLRPEAQRDLLDAFGEAEPERRGLAEAVAIWRELRRQEADLLTRRDEVRRRADYLRHVVQEIDAARLTPSEDASLDQEARRLSAIEQLTEAAGRFREAIDSEEGSALEALSRAERALSQLMRHDPPTAEWRELLDAAYANLSELASRARDYGSRLEDDPARLAEVEARRDRLHRLKQKYGATLDAVLATRGSAAEELDMLDTADLDLRTLAARRTAQEAAVTAAAAALTARRETATERLAREVNRLLPKLGMAGGRISVALTRLPEPRETGAESVEFLARLNPGMDERPLAKTASGGELSRLMLALRVVLARHDRIPTLVFDEVDQGIGGEVGTRVADALAEVAGRHQVLVITHLPQIAARADRHVVVSKRARAGIATSDVATLHGEDRVAELARMLGDPDADTARRHAIAMLRGAGGPGPGTRARKA